MSYLFIYAPVGAQVATIPDGRTAEDVAASYGITDTNLYAEFQESDFSAACLNFTTAFTLANGVVGFDLSAAKNLASIVVKKKIASRETTAAAGFSALVLASQGALAEVDRVAEVQTAIEDLNALAVELSNDIAAINAATGIDEVNNIANPPTGIISIGRGADGDEDLNLSSYVEFNSLSMSSFDTELYVPGTSTVIAYGGVAPGQFDSTGNCFNVGDYTIQIRETSTSRVIAEFEVPLNASNENISF